MKMSIAALLEAAELLERRDREAEREHGYASNGPIVNKNLKFDSKKAKTNKFSAICRSTHNELEKNRRAHLRGCMESLKNLVPLGQNSARHTTLGLLIKAKNFIKNLEFQDRRYVVQKGTLRREARHLKRKLELLHLNSNGTINGTSLTKRRSVSECSTLSSSSSTVSSSSSVSTFSNSLYLSASSGNSSSLSELDEIGTTRGYFTHSSEEDDSLSVEGDIFDWVERENQSTQAKTHADASNGQISVSSCQITLSQMDI